MYNITEVEYQAILAYQDGACAICRGKRPGNLDVDHDHRAQGQLLAAGLSREVAVRDSIRGLLCRRCNRRLLPASLDTTAILYQAIDYLNNWPADEVLEERL